MTRPGYTVRAKARRKGRNAGSERRHSMRHAVRAARWEDLPRLIEIHEKAKSGRPKCAFDVYLAGSDFAYVAGDTQPHAFMCTSAYKHGAFIDTIAVHPGMRRKGLARALVRFAKRLAPRIRLEVTARNRGARALYTSEGFSALREIRAGVLLMEWCA